MSIKESRESFFNKCDIKVLNKFVENSQLCEDYMSLYIYVIPQVG